MTQQEGSTSVGIQSGAASRAAAAGWVRALRVLSMKTLSWAREDWLCQNESKTFRAGLLGSTICEGEGGEARMENEFR